MLRAMITDPCLQQKSIFLDIVSSVVSEKGTWIYSLSLNSFCRIQKNAYSHQPSAVIVQAIFPFVFITYALQKPFYKNLFAKNCNQCPEFANDYYLCDTSCFSGQNSSFHLALVYFSCNSNTYWLNGYCLLGGQKHTPSSGQNICKQISDSFASPNP